MPPIPLLTGAYANLASEEWILQERQQIRSLYDTRLLDFHQTYVDDVSWLNEYMTGLCETVSTKGDILQAMKTPSRFQSVRKLNMTIDLKGLKPVGRLFSESSVATESSTTVSTVSVAAESVKITDSVEPKQAATTTKSRWKTELRGSMIIHHDTDAEVEVTSTAGDSMDISEDESRLPIEEPPKLLNEIEEVEEEDDEVVTVLKTPRPLNAKANLLSQDDLLESPLAGKGVPRRRDEEMDSNGSDKENVPASAVFRTIPRPSDRSDSYVTAMSSLPPEEGASQELQPRSESLRPIDVPREEEERIIETQVPVATSPPEHQMQLPSLPTRAPLNMKKSFGVRKSQRTSLMESIAGRASIIPNRKTFFGQLIQQNDQASTEPTIKLVETKSTPTETVKSMVTPVEEVSKPLTTEEAPGGKDDTITIIDTELHLGDQRLKSKFTTESQRIHDALNSLKIKSTPGQPLRDVQERVAEIETPAPVRMTERQVPYVDEEEEWIPRKNHSSLVDRLANNQDVPEIEKAPVETHIENTGTEIPKDEVAAPVIVEVSPAPQLVTSPVKAAPGPIPASPASVTFKNAAAQAVEVIRNAMAIITNPSPEPPPQQTNLYPTLNDPMTEIQPSENFTLQYDDRASLDSTYITQSDAPSQQIQIAQESVAEHRQSHTAMPPPRKDHPTTKPKPVPVSIRVPTASQRQKEQQKKALTQGTGIYPALTQSRSVPDLASPGKMARDEARMSTASLQSQGSFMRGGGQIKALNAAKMAKQREEQERERKALKKFEMERKRQEVLAKRQEEERRKHLPARGKIQKDEKRRPAAETMRPAKKLPPSPQKKQVREEAVKPPRQAPITIPTKAVKHALEQEEAKPRTVNYAGSGKSMGQPQHDQDTKRRRTEEVEDNEIIISKPMRVSVIKQDTKPMKSIGEPIRQPYTAEPKKGIKISSAHQHVHQVKNFMAPAEGVKFSNDPIAFGKPAAKRSGPPPPPKESIYPPSESIILPEIDSEYSDSEDDSPKKPSIVKPTWAESPILIAQLKRQQMINPDDVFGEIKPPAIDDIFRNNNRRGHSTFRPRTSSANWSGQDKLTREEIEEYARTMGYSKP